MSDAVRFRSFPDARGSGHDPAAYDQIRTKAAEFI